MKVTIKEGRVSASFGSLQRTAYLCHLPISLLNFKSGLRSTTMLHKLCKPLFAAAILVQHVAADYDYTKAIASIYYFPGPDCPDDGNFEKYDVMPLTGPGSGFPSPDQCDV